MALISMHNISLGYGAGLLLDNADLNIETGDHACLVGRNGTGKSTLLKLLCGSINPDDGDIRKAKDTRIAYMQQDVPPNTEGFVGEIVAAGLSAFGHSTDLWETNQAVGKVLSHVDLNGFDDFSTLSGGQKRRALLAAALVCEPDLLLLDEPTNHLDIDSIIWLEDFLLRHSQTFLFVTHDRSFARRMANRVIDLDRGKLSNWSCDYDTYLTRKEAQLHEESVRNAVFDKKLAKEEVWIRQGIKARRTRNEGRVRALLDMRNSRRDRREKEGNARISVQQAERSGRKVITATDVSFAYPKESPIISDLDVQIMRGDKIGIVGRNGSGKTTLLKLLTADLTPETGSVTHGTKLEVSYFDQHRAVLNDSASVAENVNNGNESVTINGNPRHVMSYLQDFLFSSERARSPVGVLSGGERNRLLLAKLFALPSNLLIMDEPTNDLDTETLELLEEQILDYTGTVLLVSHDRSFLDNVVSSLLILKEQTPVTEYVGNYGDWLQSGQTLGPAAAPPKKKPAKAASAPAKKLGFNEKRELKQIPGQINKLETEQNELHAKMNQPEYFKLSADDLQRDQQRLTALDAELQALYTRWEKLDTMS